MPLVSGTMADLDLIEPAVRLPFLLLLREGPSMCSSRVQHEKRAGNPGVLRALALLSQLSAESIASFHKAT